MLQGASGVGKHSLVYALASHFDVQVQEFYNGQSWRDARNARTHNSSTTSQIHLLSHIDDESWAKSWPLIFGPHLKCMTLETMPTIIITSPSLPRRLYPLVRELAISIVQVRLPHPTGGQLKPWFPKAVTKCETFKDFHRQFSEPAPLSMYLECKRIFQRFLNNDSSAGKPGKADRISLSVWEAADLLTFPSSGAGVATIDAILTRITCKRDVLYDQLRQSQSHALSHKDVEISLHADLADWDSDMDAHFRYVVCLCAGLKAAFLSVISRLSVNFQR